MVEEHIKKSDRDINIEKSRENFEDAKLLLNEIGFILSKKKVGHIHE